MVIHVKCSSLSVVLYHYIQFIVEIIYLLTIWHKNQIDAPEQNMRTMIIYIYVHIFNIYIYIYTHMFINIYIYKYIPFSHFTSKSDWCSREKYENNDNTIRYHISDRCSDWCYHSRQYYPLYHDRCYHHQIHPDKQFIYLLIIWHQNQIDASEQNMRTMIK
jgi:hypothetical protein